MDSNNSEPQSTGRSTDRQPPVFVRIAAVAANNGGVVDTKDLNALGLNRGWIARHVALGYLWPISEGVYAVGHPGLGRRARALAALRRAGEGSALSHVSAARVWGLVPPNNSGPIHVSLASRRGLSHLPGVVIHRPRRLDPADVIVRHGIPITTPLRTIRDELRTSSTTEITRMLEQAVVAHRYSPADLETWLSNIPRTTGRRRAVIALRGFAGPAVLKSQLESAFRSLCQRADLTLPATNVTVGRWEVDAIWHEYGVAVELDSWRWHGGHWSFHRDRDKGLDLARDGYELLRLTWRQLDERPEAVANAIVRTLQRHAPAGPDSTRVSERKRPNPVGASRLGRIQHA